MTTRRATGMVWMVCVLTHGLAASAAAQFIWDDDCTPNNRWHACCLLDAFHDISPPCQFPTCVPSQPQPCECLANYNNWEVQPNFVVPPACPAKPGSSDDVDLGAFDVVMDFGPPVTIRNLFSMGTFAYTAGGVFTVNQAAVLNNFNTSGGDFSVGGTLDVNGDVNFLGGAIRSGGNMIFAGDTVWRAGVLAGQLGGAATTTLMGNTTMGGGAATDVDSRTVVNEGELLWEAAGILRLLNGGRFENRGTMRDNGVDWIIAGAPSGVFENHGTYDTFNGATTFTSSVDFHNFGSMTVGLEHVRVESGGSCFGSIDVSDFGEFEFATTGDRVFTLGGGDTLNASGNGLFRYRGGGRLVLSGAGVNATNFTFDAGTLGDGRLTADRFDWTGGTVHSAIVDAETLNISGINHKIVDQGQVNVHTFCRWTDGGPIFLNNASSFDIGLGRVFEIKGNGALRGNDGVFSNRGELIKDNADGSLGTTLFAEDAFFNNQGIVRVIRGTLRIESAGSQNGPFGFRVDDPEASVQFAGVGNHVFTINSAGDTIRGPGYGHIVGTVVASGGQLAADNLRVTGTLRGPGSLIANKLEWLGGTLVELGADSRVEAMLEMDTGINKTLDMCALESNGEGRWRGSGALRLLNGAAFHNRGDFSAISDNGPLTCSFDSTNGHFHNANGATLRCIGDHVRFLGTGRFINDGDITTSADLIEIANMVEFNHAGTLQFLDDGVLQVAGPGRSTGTFQTSGDSRIRFVSNLYTLEGGTQFTGGGFIDVFSGTVQVPNGSVPISSRFLLSGTIAGAGDLLVNGPLFDWTGGRMQDVGRTIVTSPLFQIRGAFAKTLDRRSLDILSANAEYSGLGSLNLNNDAQLTIRLGGTLHANSASALSGGGGAVTNEGILVVNGPLQTGNSIRFNNRSDATLNGNLSLFGGGDFAGGQFFGTGDLALRGGTFDFAGTDVDTLGELLINSGIARVNGASHARVARLSSGTGAIEGPGEMAVDVLNWDGGTMRGAGATTISSLCILDTPGGKTLQNRTLNLDGSTDWIDGNITAGGGAVFNTRGQFNISANDSIFAGAGGATINNFGVFQKTGPPLSTTTIVPPFNQRAGTVRATAGTIRFAGPFNQTAGLTRCDLGAALAFDGGYAMSGGRLVGTGVANGNVTVSGGRVQPGASPGLLSIQGAYSQSAGGMLEVELGGPSAGAGHDLLSISGGAALGGTLHILPTAGFVPQPGQQFTILTAGLVTGQFGSVTGPGEYSITYHPTSVVVTVVSSPCPGDMDGNDSADLADLAMLLSNFGRTESVTYDEGDLNGDGAVDLGDLALLLANFGSNCG